ncbi:MULTISPECIES: hypothetical protein [unclassified Granulicatella]|uniref:hypothetical protein n=1 Tax=unclassified Granulicatella TaxID=2630493 RepID=UPI00107427FC|nr:MULTISPECIES: hypothetical protein [unclassified Granulicatella]MBF0779797.1 hypothetical protein [Granulicatella sp. 19428wC4_WM01]TFU96199.1 hypothetical protein E4T68_01695 [Granulicatella sp. WM01]
MIDSYNRQKLSKQREQALLNEVLAIQIGNFVGSMFSKQIKIRNVRELLPALFEEENQQEWQWQEHMQKMREFTARHNQRRKEMD